MCKSLLMLHWLHTSFPETVEAGGKRALELVGDEVILYDAGRR